MSYKEHCGICRPGQCCMTSGQARCATCGGNILLDDDPYWGKGVTRARCIQCGREPGLERITAPPVTAAERAGFDGLGRGFRFPTLAEVRAAKAGTQQCQLFLTLAGE